MPCHKLNRVLLPLIPYFLLCLLLWAVGFHFAACCSLVFLDGRGGDGGGGYTVSTQKRQFPIVQLLETLVLKKNIKDVVAMETVGMTSIAMATVTKGITGNWWSNHLGMSKLTIITWASKYIHTHTCMHTGCSPHHSG